MFLQEEVIGITIYFVCPFCHVFCFALVFFVGFLGGFFFDGLVQKVRLSLNLPTLCLTHPFHYSLQKWQISWQVTQGASALLKLWPHQT